MSVIAFDYNEADVCVKCEKGFLGKKFSHCPFCGSKLSKLVKEK